MVPADRGRNRLRPYSVALDDLTTTFFVPFVLFVDRPFASNIIFCARSSSDGARSQSMVPADGGRNRLRPLYLSDGVGSGCRAVGGAAGRCAPGSAETVL